jgi:nicotinamide-nucleotide amidase
MNGLFPVAIEDLARQVLAEARARGIKVCTAESCTGGLVAGALTEIPGSSDVFDRGYSTYSNTAKIHVLGVGVELLKAHGAVSEACARAMAQGALAASGADAAVAITGIAGPGGGTAAKPAGLVHFAAIRRSEATLAQERRFGDIGRGAVRIASVEAALNLLLKAIRG